MFRQKHKTLASLARHYITIQDRANTTDEEGGFTQNWTDNRSLFAAVIPVQARQIFQYKSIGVDATHHIKLRGQESIDVKTQRISFGGRYFEILVCEDLQELHFEKLLTCRELDKTTL